MRWSLADRALAITTAFAILLTAVLFVFDRECVRINLVSSNEKSALLADIADGWSRTAYVDGRCAIVKVVRVPSGDAEAALARGWIASADGPLPDVWSPASSSWALLLRQHRAEMVPATLPSVMRSPLVIAMPKPMGEALGWPDLDVTWRQLIDLSKDPQGWARYGHPEWGAFRLGKTDPFVSTSGLHALLATYFAAKGRVTAETDVADPQVIEFVRGVEQSVVHYSDTVAAFLTNIYEADRRRAALSYVSAVAVEEKQVWDYNNGVIVGESATTTRPPLPPRTPLVAMYPMEGTLVADHPYVILAAPWSTEQKRRVAEAFLAHLQSGRIQARFSDAAFRDHLGHSGPQHKKENGLLDRSPLIVPLPAPRTLELVQRSWNDVRKRARVILAIDVSQPMGARDPSGETGLDQVKRAASAAVDQLAADDEVGLWTFSTGSPGGASFRELVPVSRVATRRTELKSAIADLRVVAGGRTALYAAARASVRVLGASVDPGRVNAVVILTTGRNDDPADPDRTSLLAELQSQPEGRLVRVFTIGYGEGADDETLQLIAQASGGAFKDAHPGAIDDVLRAVIRSF